MVVDTRVADAFFYGRVSTAAQAGEKHASLDTQEARASDYCASHGLRLVDSFVDVQSARRDDRTNDRRCLLYTSAAPAEEAGEGGRQDSRGKL